jgi:photosystem II stability/assembly factor-like uncharacterized protein
MKIFSAFLIFCALLFTNCKEAATPPEEVTNIIKTAPFENSDFKLERASTNLPEGVTKIHFFDESNGVCLTENGSTYTTTDRGLTWILNYGFSKGVNCILQTSLEVVDNQTVIVLCAFSCASTRYNEIRRSADKGKTWATTQIKQTQLQNMTLGADKVLYVFGNYSSDLFMSEKHTLLTSQDAGLTWRIDTITTTFCPLSQINYLSNNNLIVNSNSKTFENREVLSTDKGKTWTTKENATEFILGAWHGDKLSYYMSRDNAKGEFFVYQSTNGGANWAKVKTTNNITNDVKVLSATNALILGKGNSNSNAGFSYTFDAAKTWKDMNLLDNLDAGQLITSSFYTPKNGYIVATKKVLYKITLKK